MTVLPTRPGVGWALACAAALSGSPADGQGSAERLPASRFLAGRHTGEHGALSYRLFLPAALQGGQRVPLVVLLHGCTQDARDVAAGTRMNRLAEEHGFLVLYPEQDAAAHPQRCWSWFDPAHQQRGAGEPARIAGAVREVVGAHPVDPRRVYLAGISAGGAMSVILAVTYPELFAAVGVHSGVAYRLAASAPEALRVMRDPGAVAVGSGSGEPFRAPPLIAFQGGADAVVSPANLDALVEQWRGWTGEAAEREEQGEAGGYRCARRVWEAQGESVLEAWRVEGLGHAWSGGSPRGSYTDPRGPDASREMLRFFLRHSRPG